MFVKRILHQKQLLLNIRKKFMKTYEIINVTNVTKTSKEKQICKFTPMLFMKIFENSNVTRVKRPFHHCNI